VVAPPDNETQVISCPICKESLALEFLEEEEEWAWRNATKKDDKVKSMFIQTAYTYTYLFSN